MAKTCCLLRLAVGRDAAKNLDVAAVHFGHEEVTVGSGNDVARILNVGGVQLDLEAGGGLRPGILWAIDDVRPVRRRLGGVGCGQILGRDLVNRAGLLVTEIGERSRLAAAWKLDFRRRQNRQEVRVEQVA